MSNLSQVQFSIGDKVRLRPGLDRPLASQQGTVDRIKDGGAGEPVIRVREGRKARWALHDDYVRQ